MIPLWDHTTPEPTAGQPARDLLSSRVVGVRIDGVVTWLDTVPVEAAPREPSTGVAAPIYQETDVDGLNPGAEAQGAVPLAGLGAGAHLLALPPAAVRRRRAGALVARTGTQRYVHRLYASRSAMKVANSLRSLKKRHKDCQVVKRRGRVYVINKTNPRFKARQGSAKKK